MTITIRVFNSNAELKICNVHIRNFKYFELNQRIIDIAFKSLIIKQVTIKNSVKGSWIPIKAKSFDLVKTAKWLSYLFACLLKQSQSGPCLRSLCSLGFAYSRGLEFNSNFLLLDGDFTRTLCAVLVGGSSILMTEWWKKKNHLQPNGGKHELEWLCLS